MLNHRKKRWVIGERSDVSDEVAFKVLFNRFETEARLKKRIFASFDPSKGRKKLVMFNFCLDTNRRFIDSLIDNSGVEIKVTKNQDCIFSNGQNKSCFLKEINYSFFVI